MPIISTPPPAKSNTNSSGKTSTVARATPRVTHEREEMVAQLGMFAQVPLLATKQLADAATIGLHWPKIAHELAVLAETQEAIANVIDPLIKVGPFAGLIAAAIPLVMQLGVNHGRLKPGSMGTVPAVALQSQMEASMAKVELEAMRAQLEAEKEANAARREIDNSRRALADAMRDHTHESADVSA
jgi:hypothetical protein